MIVARLATWYPWQTSLTRSFVRSHARNLLSIARLKIARSRTRAESWRRMRMAQISLSLSGGFWPMSLPLFQGILAALPSLVTFMTISFHVKGEPVCADRQRAIPDPQPPLGPASRQRRLLMSTRHPRGRDACRFPGYQGLRRSQREAVTYRPTIPHVRWYSVQRRSELRILWLSL